MSSYDATFFDYVNSGSLQSAEKILPVLLNELEVSSVLDAGCGQGAWLSVWQKLGVKQVVGIDGEYVDTEHLLISKESFIPSDLRRGFDLGRRFDLVQSLEVAEHLPAKSASEFIDNLVKHGDLILFSAAAKGQGGHNHINEQDYDYWRALFAKHGYIAIDYIRPLVADESAIEPWYRYNMILYASADRFTMLPEVIQGCRVADSQAITDVSPPIYKMRKRLIRLLPVSILTLLAKLKERYVLRVRRT